MWQLLRWTSNVAFLLICLHCVHATADEPEVTAIASTGGPALCYDAWIIEMSPREADRVLGTRAPVLRRSVCRLRPCAGRWLLDRAEGKRGMRVRKHVSGCVEPGGSSPIEDLGRYTYVMDYDIEISMGVYLADPVIETIYWGVKLALHADPVGTFRLEGHISALVRPVTEFDVDLSERVTEGPTSATIQLPELRMAEIKAKRKLSEEDWFLVGSRMHFQATGEPPKRRYVLLRVGPESAAATAAAK